MTVSSSKQLRRVYLEISNVCNLKCSFCPEVERRDAVMDVEDFRQAIAQVAPLADEVCLHLMGEPLGHPHLAELIELCAKEGVPINLTTNGVLLHGERVEILLSPGIRQVNLSLQSFAANFPARDISPYFARIMNFVHLASARRPDLYINLRLWDLLGTDGRSPHNVILRELISKEFACEDLWERVNVRRKKRWLLRGRVYLAFDSRFEWPSLAAPVQGERGFCHGLSTHVGIHADGTVVPCCLDKEAAVPLGNIRKSSLDAILKSPRATAMKDGFAQGVLVEDLCRRCTFIQRFGRKAVVKKHASKKVTLEHSHS
jgi:radical SAM protein with 4Fe4S-binding SPASM domain